MTGRPYPAVSSEAGLPGEDGTRQSGPGAEEQSRNRMTKCKKENREMHAAQKQKEMEKPKDGMEMERPKRQPDRQWGSPW